MFISTFDNILIKIIPRDFASVCFASVFSGIAGTTINNDVKISGMQFMK